jgi:hypothetical protein
MAQLIRRRILWMICRFKSLLFVVCGLSLLYPFETTTNNKP